MYINGMFAIDLKVVTNCIAVLDSEGPDPKWIPTGTGTR